MARAASPHHPRKRARKRTGVNERKTAEEQSSRAQGCSPGYCRHKHGQTGLRNFPSAQFRSEDLSGRAAEDSNGYGRDTSVAVNDASNKHYVQEHATQRQQLLGETGRAHAAADRCVAESKSGRPRRSGWGEVASSLSSEAPSSSSSEARLPESIKPPKPGPPLRFPYYTTTSASNRRPPPTQHFRPRATVAQKPQFPPPPPPRDQKGSDVTSPFRGRRHTPATASVEEGRPQLDACGGRSSLLDRLGPTRGGR